MRSGNQLRVGAGGAIIGFDVQALTAIAAALGYDAAALLHLFHYAELGLHQAIKQQYGNHDNEKHSDPPRAD